MIEAIVAAIVAVVRPRGPGGAAVIEAIVAAIVAVVVRPRDPGGAAVIEAIVAAIAVVVRPRGPWGSSSNRGNSSRVGSSSWSTGTLGASHWCRRR